jgi:O-antigen/teichoic acid export membrane protein
VYFHKAALLWPKNYEQLRPLILKVTRNLLIVSFAPALVVLAFGPQIFALVLGETWREAGRYATFLIPMTVAGLVSTSFTPTFFVTERQDLQLLREVIRLAVIGSAFGVAVLFDTSPAVTVALVALASTLGYLLLFATVWRAALQPSDDPASLTGPAAEPNETRPQTVATRATA